MIDLSCNASITHLALRLSCFSPHDTSSVTGFCSGMRKALAVPSLQMTPQAASVGAKRSIRPQAQRARHVAECIIPSTRLLGGVGVGQSRDNETAWGLTPEK